MIRFFVRILSLVLILFAYPITNLFSQTGSVLTFSEVMFRPLETNGEFIEIYNTSATETIDLTNYKIKYYTSANDNLVGFIGGMLLAPGKFAVVIENDYDWNNGVYKNMIPADAIVLKIADNSFGTSGMANTTSRDINLINLFNQTIDTYTYSADNTDGISDEKYILDKDNSAGNWRNCLNSHGTPGKKNSVSPVDFDLRITFFGFTPATPTAEDSLRLTFIVKNIGRLAANNFIVQIFNDANSDTLGQPVENIITGNYATLASGDSLIITVPFFPPTQSNYKFLATITFIQDENTTNNMAYTSISVAQKITAFNDIVINEIMYSPTGDEPEWIEVFNKSNRTINLRNFRIGDASALVTISTTDYNLDPLEYLIVAKENTINNFYNITSNLLVRSLPTLNNSGDDVILRDNYNRTIDSLKYQSNWGGSSGSRSLERISPNGPSTASTNWGTSVSINRATPGKINSLAQKNNDLSIKSFSTNVSFAQIGSNLSINTEVENKGLFQANNFSLDLFHDINFNQIPEPAEIINTTNFVSLGAGQTVTDIFLYQNFVVGVNQFIAVVNFGDDEYFDNNSSNFSINGVVINELRGDLVINEIMYAPNASEPEWVEVFNRSTKNINMFGYKISDDATTTRVINQPLTLNPNEYLVIAKDSSITNVHGAIPILRISNFATLNNSGDRVILRDSLDRVIDSLDYKSTWGGTNGKSLERIDVNRASTDSTNWKTSIAVLGSTPGNFNSNTPFDNDLSVSIFSHMPASPIKGDSVAINIRIENIGKNGANNFSIEIFEDANLDSTAQTEERIFIQNYTALQSSQSITLQIKIYAAEVRLYRLIGRLNFPPDESTSNNLSIKEFSVLEVPASVNEIVINEIMYAPTGDEPEWIEIYNRSNRALNLKNWRIGDNTALATISTTDLLLNSHQYMVLSSDAAISNFYNITSQLVIRSLPSLSNTGDDVKLRDNFNKTIDSLKYLPSWGGTNGKSLERKYEDSLSTMQSNWGTSVSPNRATPGLFNSISPLPNNMSVEIISYVPSIPIRGDSISVNIRIKNSGRNIARDFYLEIYNDLNLDNIPQQTERIDVKNYTSLISMATEYYSVKFFASDVRTYRIIATLFWTFDEFAGDNISIRDIAVIEVPAYANEIVINEIMYAPAGEEPEWIELFNRSNRPLNLKDWKLGDNTALTILSSNDFLLESGEYLIVSSEPNIQNFYNITSKLLIKVLPSLSNSGDDVKLKDNANRIIDSLKYLPSWGGTNGKSLERKDVDSLSTKQSNWGTSNSKNKATPGIKNSITPREKELAVRNFKFANKYAYDISSTLASFWIVNNGTKDAEQILYKVFNDINKNSILEQNEITNSGDISKILFRDSIKITFTLPSFLQGENNVYAVVELNGDEIIENNQAAAVIIGVTPSELRNDLVINEIMYAPNSPEPEWIEIFNRSNKAINLKGYQIADEASKSTILKSDFIIEPNNYSVIARDSNIIYYYSSIEKLIVSSFPSLNNNGDRIVLIDSLNRTIDSLSFKSSWGGMSGKSLERIDTEKSSADSTNWKITTATRGTPGKINSRSKKDYNVTLLLPSITPINPKVGESVKINAGLLNSGKNVAVFTLKLYEIENDGKKSFVKEKLITISPTNEVIAYLTEMEYEINNLTKTRLFEYYADYSQDEDTTDNRVQIRVRPGFNTNMVLINEIMYNPTNGEPEWIELYNNSYYEIDFEDWILSDVLTNPQTTKLKRNITAPQSYVVITKDSSIINFHTTIPSKMIVSAIANLNNDADGIVLKDSYSTIIDSVLFDKTWGGENGKSLERKLITVQSNKKTNWASSQDIELSTPGRMNSITPYNYDLAILEIGYSPSNATSSDEVNLKARVTNKGLNTAANYLVEFYFVSGNDTLLFSSGNGFNLVSGDTTEIFSALKIKLSNPKSVYCKVVFPNDEFLANNKLTITLSAGFKQNSIVISEIMYNPFEGESEWIEIVNLTDSPINLKDWKVSDVIPSLNKVSISTTDNFLQPKEFAILTPDTGKFPYYPPEKFFQVKFGSLSNTSDGLVIYDYRGNTIDSLIYYSHWGGTKGASLERISFEKASNDSSNWITSINKFGATPGLPNSYKDVPQYSKGSLIINEIMYEPESNNSEFVEFYNPLSDSIQLAGINLFVAGKKVSFSSTYYNVPAKSFLILAQDSTIYNNYPLLKLAGNYVLCNSSLSLSNSGSQLVLKDARGTTLDSVYYLPNWHNRNLASTKNRSLERLNPSLGSNDFANWSSSVATEGASPGKANSVFTEITITESKAVISPNPFSPDNDGFEDFTTINFSLSQKLAQVRIKVFDSQGRLVRTISDNRPSGPNNSVIFNGLDDNGRPLRIGIYILLIEIVKDNGDYEVMKLPVVIARKL